MGVMRLMVEGKSAALLLFQRHVLGKLWLTNLELAMFIACK